MSLLKKVGKALRKAAKPVGKVLTPVASSYLNSLPGGNLVSPLLAVNAKQRSSPVSLTSANSYMGSEDWGYYPMAGLPAPVPPLPRAPAPRPMPRGATPKPVPRPYAGSGGMPKAKVTPFGMLYRFGKAAAEAAGWAAVGKYWVDQVGNVQGVRTTRHMNPLNAHALRRAIRRVKGAKRICHEVEKITGHHRRAPARSCAPRRGRC